MEYYRCISGFIATDIIEKLFYVYEWNKELFLPDTVVSNLPFTEIVRDYWYLSLDFSNVTM